MFLSTANCLQLPLRKSPRNNAISPEIKIFFFEECIELLVGSRLSKAVLSIPTLVYIALRQTETEFTLGNVQLQESGRALQAQ